MGAPITYLFDPFCGWCYAAAPQIARIRQAVVPRAIQAFPTGLFAGEGKPMTPEFRDYAWSNDQRIAKMTGQPFSQAYYDDVLSNFSRPFDSGPATKAIAVAEMMRPGGSAFDMLARAQKARFVEGKDLTERDNLLALAIDLGLDGAEFAESFDGPEGAAAKDILIENGQTMMEHLRLRGVPALALLHGTHFHPVSGEALIDPDAGLVEKLGAQFGPEGTGMPAH